MMTTFRKFRRQTDQSCLMHPKRPPGPALAPATALERLKFSMRLSVTDQKFSCSAWGDEPEAPLLAKLLKL